MYSGSSELKPDQRKKIIDTVEKYSCITGPVNIMEVCGTHTMSISRSGLRTVLPGNISLLSGPGCPVCVTSQADVDMVLELSDEKDVIIASYGDLLRVPGSRTGDSLFRRKAEGSDVRAVYSPVDALEIAEKNGGKEVVFLGVGFETTAPGTAACILDAAKKRLDNFSVLCLLKRTEPALRTLIEADDFNVSGFICPGHVAVITGWKRFSFLAEEYGLPGVVSGFEPDDILCSVAELMRMIKDGKPEVKNEYIRMVRPQGNPAAIRIMEEIFDTCSSRWRGLGIIENSGYRLKEKYAGYDAYRKFSLKRGDDKEIGGCRCGQIIRGVERPKDCLLFGDRCTPAEPVGPCMVSSEGACAAAYMYE